MEGDSTDAGIRHQAIVIHSLVDCLSCQGEVILLRTQLLQNHEETRDTQIQRLNRKTALQKMWQNYSV